MTLREDTSKTLAVLSLVLLGLGLLVGSPGARLLLCALAVLPALPVAAFAGKKGVRLLAAAALVAALAASAASLPAFRGHMDAYRLHGKGADRPSPPAASAPGR
jgi:hypothetical protein